ncbi:V-type proton ATPase subunit e 2-like [Plodia interpunctella]|uniref:V-type proton ATPase subunit e 2-like n=1 Tax=Plodia interpunctella TaxID=58824 RepID=UPI002367EB4E|nr:V-type proton ATPase subunit e 2-like [Plodia interpunctella]
MDKKYIPIIVITSVFGAIFAFGPCFVRKGPNSGMIKACIMMTAFSVWIFWVTAYIAQMNPLAGPRLHNTTLAWIQYAFGNTVATPLAETDIDLFEDDDRDSNSDYYT